MKSARYVPMENHFAWKYPLPNCSNFLSQPVWPDWAIYWTLGNFLRPLAAITLPKSYTFLGNFCKGAKITHFSSEINFGQLFIEIWRFLSGHSIFPHSAIISVGWFTLDAVVCIFRNGLCQCRDSKFSISLQKCNCLPQTHAENAVTWMSLNNCEDGVSETNLFIKLILDINFQCFYTTNWSCRLKHLILISAGVGAGKPGLVSIKGN